MGFDRLFALRCVVLHCVTLRRTCMCSFVLHIALVPIALRSLELYFIASPRTSFAHFCLQCFAFHGPRIRFPWQCAALHCHCIDCISFTALHFFALNCMEASLSVMRLCSANVVDTSSSHVQSLCGAIRQPSRRLKAAQSHPQDGLQRSPTAHAASRPAPEASKTLEDPSKTSPKTAPTSKNRPIPFVKRTFLAYSRFWSSYRS